MIRLTLTNGTPITLRLSAIEAIVGEPKDDFVYLKTRTGDSYAIQNHTLSQNEKDTFTMMDLILMRIEDRIKEERDALTDRSHL